MFDIGWAELMVIAVVAIVVIGPKDLPRALRTVGQWTGKLKRMARDFQSQFTEAIREAELDAVQRDLEALTKLDPVADVRAAAAKTGEDIRRDLERAGQPPAPSSQAREPYPWEQATTPAPPTVPAVGPAANAPPAPPAVPAPAEPVTAEPKP
jgi:sec-independent protein translocase protein TatB